MNSVGSGRIISLDEVNDPVFSQKMMGDGFALIPTSGDITAPIAGKVSLVFPTKHAYGITSREGIEVLVHLGINTVDLDGEGFDTYVSVGNWIEEGDMIASMDLELMNAKGIDPTVMVIITSGQAVEMLKEGFDVNPLTTNIVRIIK